MNSSIKIFALLILAAIFARCKKEIPLKPPELIEVDGSTMGRASLSVMDPASSDVAWVCVRDGQWGVQRASTRADIRWFLPLGSTEQPYSLVANDAFDLFVCGVTVRDYPTKKADAFVMKLNAQGDTLWNKVYGNSSEEQAHNILMSNDGGAIVAGLFTEQSEHGIFLFRIKSNGDTVWTRKIHFEENIQISHFLKTRNGEYFITGVISNGESKVYYLRIDGNGKTLWSGNGLNMHSANVSVEMADGSIVTCGNSFTMNPMQAMIHRMDKTGKILWEQFYGAQDVQPQVMDIKQNADGSMFMTGVLNMGFANHVMLLKIDGEGNNLYSRRVNAHNFGFGANVLKDKNDDNVILGNLNDKAFFLRTDNQGNFK